MFYFSSGFQCGFKTCQCISDATTCFLSCGLKHYITLYYGLKLKRNVLKLSIYIKKKKSSDVFVNRPLCLNVLLQVVRCVARHCCTALYHGWRAVKGSEHTMGPRPGTWAPLFLKRHCTTAPQGLCLSTLLRPRPLLLPLLPHHCQLAMPALTSSRSLPLLQKMCPQTQLCRHSLLVLHCGPKTKNASSTSCPRA